MAPLTIQPAFVLEESNLSLWQWYLAPATRAERVAVHLVVAPDKAYYYRVLFPALHAIYGSDFHVFAVHRTQHGCEECDLCLVPEPP